MKRAIRMSAKDDVATALNDLTAWKRVTVSASQINAAICSQSVI